MRQTRNLSPPIRSDRIFVAGIERRGTGMSQLAERVVDLPLADDLDAAIDEAIRLDTAPFIQRWMCGQPFS